MAYELPLPTIVAHIVSIKLPSNTLDKKYLATKWFIILSSIFLRHNYSIFRISYHKYICYIKTMTI